MHQKSTILDCLLLSLFCIFILFNPHFSNGEINIFELGLYLPGIQAVLEGQVPFRDFFHLRGPFELYMPAALMKIFGEHIKVLHLYFYIGNLLCLFLCILIAKEILRSRLLLYLLVPVLTVKGFPRITYMQWGGMRYAFGLLAIYCFIKYVKEKKYSWMIGAGLATACGLFTSIEIGIFAILGILGAFLFAWIFKLDKAKDIFNASGRYVIGIVVIVIPYLIYLIVLNAYYPFIDTVITVVTRMEMVLNQHILYTFPKNFIEALMAMFNPVSPSFKHLTPAYLYLFLLCLLAYRAVKGKLSSVDIILVGLGIYGFVMYNKAFRAIWAAQFDMAMQPEKILLFYMVEQFYFVLWAQSQSILAKMEKIPLGLKDQCALGGIYFLMLGLVGSSIGLPIDRYNDKYYSFKYVRNVIKGKETDSLNPLYGQASEKLYTEQVQGLIVPQQQAEEIEGIAEFLHYNTNPNDQILVYPEMGIYHFIADRPFVGRFPLVTFSWFKDEWFEDFMDELNSKLPQYAIIEQKPIPFWEETYFVYPPNRVKHKIMLDFVKNNYELHKTTAMSYIYKLKEN